MSRKEGETQVEVIRPDKAVVVFWYPDEPTTRAATSIHLTRGKLSKDFHRSLPSGSIKDLFQAMGISLKLAMMEFPDDIVPTHKDNVKDWDDTQLMWQRIPKNRDDLQRLVDMVNLPLSAYVFPNTNRRKTSPEHLFDLEPAIEASYTSDRKLGNQKRLDR